MVKLLSHRWGSPISGTGLYDPMLPVSAAVTTGHSLFPLQAQSHINRGITLV